jgi:hypothetical protein
MSKKGGTTDSRRRIQKQIAEEKEKQQIAEGVGGTGNSKKGRRRR